MIDIKVEPTDSQKAIAVEFPGLTMASMRVAPLYRGHLGRFRQVRVCAR